MARTYTGTSRKSLQNALEKAVASALRAAGGADRSIKWALKSDGRVTRGVGRARGHPVRCLRPGKGDSCSDS